MQVYDKTVFSVFVLLIIHGIAKNAIFDTARPTLWLPDIRYGMRKVPLFIIMILILLLPACSPKSGSRANIVKPKYHHRWYDRKKDKRTGRTKTVRMKG